MSEGKADDPSFFANAQSNYRVQVKLTCVFGYDMDGRRRQTTNQSCSKWKSLAVVEPFCLLLSVVEHKACNGFLKRRKN